MGKNNNTPEIEIKANNIIKIGDVKLDAEALEVLADIQNPLGGYYRKGLQRIIGLLISECEAMSVEYDEIMRLLQMLSNLRDNLRTLMWPANPGASRSGFDMWLEQCEENKSAEDVAAEFNPAPDEDDDSGVQDAGN